MDWWKTERDEMEEKAEDKLGNASGHVFPH